MSFDSTQDMISRVWLEVKAQVMSMNELQSPVSLGRPDEFCEVGSWEWGSDRLTVGLTPRVVHTDSLDSLLLPTVIASQDI